MNMQVLNQVSEAELQATVCDLMDAYGWCWIHNRPGRTRNGSYVTPVSGSGARGWPDLFATRGNEAVAWELKRMKGRTSTGQIDWLARLDLIPGIDARVIRPSDLDWIEERLKPDPAQPTFTMNSTSASWHPSSGRF